MGGNFSKENENNLNLNNYKEIFEDTYFFKKIKIKEIGLEIETDTSC